MWHRDEVIAHTVEQVHEPANGRVSACLHVQQRRAIHPYLSSGLRLCQPRSLANASKRAACSALTAEPEPRPTNIMLAHANMMGSARTSWLGPTQCIGQEKLATGNTATHQGVSSATRTTPPASAPPSRPRSVAPTLTKSRSSRNRCGSPPPSRRRCTAREGTRSPAAGAQSKKCETASDSDDRLARYGLPWRECR
jgi:hypothetical protein